MTDLVLYQNCLLYFFDYLYVTGYYSFTVCFFLSFAMPLMNLKYLFLFQVYSFNGSCSRRISANGCTSA